jgi:hypothetical protein
MVCGQHFLAVRDDNPLKTSSVPRFRKDCIMDHIITRAVIGIKTTQIASAYRFPLARPFVYQGKRYILFHQYGVTSQKSGGIGIKQNQAVRGRG